MNLVDWVCDRGSPTQTWFLLKRRQRRKIEQLIIDEITFVCSGVIAILAFWFLVPQPPLALTILCWAELLLLLILGCEMIIYADLAEGR